jgi:atypical dual specificity phosphatase
MIDSEGRLDADRITQEVWCGATLEEDDLSSLIRLGISRVVNLETSQHYDFQALLRARIDYFNIPVQDIDYPLPELVIEQTVTAIDEAARRGRRVYVHCTAGWQRSPAIVACYLIYKGLSAEQSFELVKQMRPAARFYASHISSAIRYEARLRLLGAGGKAGS